MLPLGRPKSPRRVPHSATSETRVKLARAVLVASRGFKRRRSYHIVVTRLTPANLKHPWSLVAIGSVAMFALRTQRLFAPLSRSALPRLSCTRQLCTPAAKPEEPADDGQPKLLYEGGKNKVRACAPRS